MLRKGERNNWGVLLAWSFYLSGEKMPAVVTVLILNIFLWRETSKPDRKELPARFLTLATLYMVIEKVNGYVKGPFFLLLLAANLSLYLPLLVKGKIAFRDAGIWLLIGFIFYALTLIIPLSYLSDAGRMKAVNVIAILFLPYAFSYVLCDLFRWKKYTVNDDFPSENMINYK